MRGARCAEGSSRGPGVPSGRRNGLWAWVGPWQYRIRVYRVGGRVVPTRYTPPGTTQLLHHPGYPPAHPPTRAAAGHLGHAHMTVFSWPKEILGVEYAQYPGSGHGSRTPHLTPAPPRDPSRLPGAGCEAAAGPCTLAACKSCGLVYIQIYI